MEIQKQLDNVLGGMTAEDMEPHDKKKPKRKPKVKLLRVESMLIVAITTQTPVP